jgi:hypothetical protein
MLGRVLAGRVAESGVASPLAVGCEFGHRGV